ncbi:unnamed protein product [Bursaphelenchus okinawaensis]|uniref:G-protein coupled receptors family 1 profile domain-containing protein n=1 Tax=Bursaphelenchus okinawaensis TaxID=465554 RepID=A0A811LJU6_9BILA|nr:unnamed protein product [Bursaphelenchus okinawaensis]CAG9124423.1 unnamed protein product [Bursaphelenchus okinawaensis]
MLLDPSTLSAETLARASVIFSVFVLLLFSSLTSIHVLLSNRNLNEVTGFYMISLAFGDFLWAVMIVPLSFYSSLTPNWSFMGDDSALCKYSAYLQIIIMTSTMYTFGWICVDRYSAFMKPSKYESEQTITRCKCWITLTWVTAILTACPVIVAKMEANYYQEFEFCVLNWSSAAAYSITLLVLVLVPSVGTMLFTACSIFSAMKKPEELEDIQRTALETDQNFVVTLFVVISFILAWCPIVAVHFVPESLLHPADTATIKFALIWLAIGGQSSKWLIYMFTNREFRRHFCIPCLGKDIDDPMDSEAEIHSPGCLKKLFCLPCYLMSKREPVRVVHHRSSMIPQPVQRVSAAQMARTASLTPHMHQSYSYYNGSNGASPSMVIAPKRQLEYGSFAQIPAGF